MRGARACWLGLVGLLVVSLVGCTTTPSEQPTLITDGVVEPTLDRKIALAPYENARAAMFRGWLGDAALVVTRFAEHSQLHRVTQPLGMREQLTFAEEAVNYGWPAPGATGSSLVYPADVGGSESYQLFSLDLGSGASRLLSDGKSRYTGVVWARSGAFIAYSTTERNGRSTDIHLLDNDGGRRIAFETDDVGWMVEDIAPGDDRLLLRRYVSVRESHLYELDLDTGTRRPLLGADVRAGIGMARYAADGSAVYFNSDLGGEFVRLQWLDLESDRLQVVTDAIPWDVEEFALSGDGSLLAFTVNEAGASRLTVLSLPQRGQLALPELPSGVVRGLEFNHDGGQLGFSLNGSQSPSDAYSIDIDSRALVRWTQSEKPGLDASSLVVPEVVAVPSFDLDPAGHKRQIPAFLYLPSGPGPHPVVVAIHGGPESQYRPRFRYFTQYLVREMGIAVIAPNVRGSRGYGKTYLALDDGVRREDSVKDIGALLDWIGTHSALDADRVAVSGGSYGGYMSLAALVHYSDRLRAGIDLFGISNFVTFLEGTQAYRRDLRRPEYGDERDPEMRAFLERISPLNQVERMTVPLFVYQGLNDPRVPAAESEQMVAALRRRDVPFWYVLATDEGHGMRRRSTRDYVYAATAEFLARYLLDEGN